jgi:NodT family efflux transporter outer membrane factor (OMF) lipoprotein
VTGLAGKNTARANNRQIAAGLFTCALAAGCTVGPDFHRPEAPNAVSYTRDALPPMTASADVPGGETQRFISGRDIPADWWNLFHSEGLNTLIRQALKQNPSLQSAEAALRVAMENVRAQQGMYFPAIAADVSVNREKASATLSPPLSTNALFFSLYQTQLTASWAPDIFGANRRQVESLKALADAQRFRVEATYLALTANVVAAAIQEGALRSQINAIQSVIQSTSDTLEILHRQLDLGQIAGSDVATQEAALAEVRQELPPLEKALAQQRDLLTALAGRLPSDEIEQTFDLSSIVLPQDIPVSVPSALVTQRPDVRAAEGLLHAASADIGVAVANLLPNITLTAADGSVATEIGRLLSPGGGLWMLSANLSQPVFQGGTLIARTRAARAAYDQAASDYRSTVIAAFQNVADVLHALQSDASALNAAAATEAASTRSLNIARRRLELGQTNYLEFLTAQGAYQRALISRVQAQASRYADTAALFQALGGGWWNRSPDEGAEDKEAIRKQVYQD